MGLIRKMTSMGTMGAVDFKSDKERTATYTKAAAKEAKKQTKIMKDQASGSGSGIGLRKLPSGLTGRGKSEAVAEVSDIADQLTKLAALRDQGVLTEDEFAAQKAKLLA